MLYHGFYVEFVPMTNIPKEDRNGEIVCSDGYEITIYSDVDKTNPVNKFYAAEGFEILSAALEEAEQFAKDVIDLEQKMTISDS